MTETRQSESIPACKVIPLHRPGGRILFGLSRSAGAPAFPVAPFPDLLAIDRVLLEFATNALELGAPRIHERFVERPDPDGYLYYLIEEEARPDSPSGALSWLEAAAVAREAPPPDRRAMARAIGFLSGQRFGRPPPG